PLPPFSSPPPPPPPPPLFPYTTFFRSFAPEVAVLRPLRHVAVFDERRRALGGPRAEVHGQKRFGLDASAPGEELFGSEGVGLNRSEEHTSELQSPYDLVCRVLLEKKKK